jgi:hypothetical protein
MRYYPRMGDIEVISFDLWHEDAPSGPASSPLIDWSFFSAWPRLRGGSRKAIHEGHARERTSTINQAQIAGCHCRGVESRSDAALAGRSERGEER